MGKVVTWAGSRSTTGLHPGPYTSMDTEMAASRHTWGRLPFVTSWDQGGLSGAQATYHPIQQHTSPAIHGRATLARGSYDSL